MDAAKVLADLTQGPLLPAYILVGEEGFLKDEVVAKIKGRALGATGDGSLTGGGELNFQAFDGHETSATAITQMAEVFPFFAERRLIIVKDPDLTDASWAKYLESPQPTTCLVLYCHTNPPAKALAPLKESGKHGQLALVECSSPKRDVTTWAVERARKLGHPLPRDAAQVLVDAVGANLLALDTEIQKLSVYAGEKRPLTVADVQAVVGRLTLPVIFEYLDAVVAGDASTALAKLSGMLSQPGSELQILSTVHGQYRRVLLARALLDEGVPVEALLPQVHPSQWMARKCLDQARRLPGDAGKRAISRLFEADMAIKTGQQEPRLALELLSLDLCSLERHTGTGARSRNHR